MKSDTNMKHCCTTRTTAASLILTICLIGRNAQAQERTPQRENETGAAVAQAAGGEPNNQQRSSVFVTEIPPGYRDWKLISVAREEGDLDDIRAILGNDIAIKAYREGKFPFPNGSIIVRLAWTYLSSEENNKAFGRAQSFVAGAPKNGVQFMVKDTAKYAATGGWGYGEFNDGKPSDVAALTSCFSCHEAFKHRDFIFTKYAP